MNRALINANALLFQREEIRKTLSLVDENPGGDKY